ncbi:hypothetical protein [Erwinia persicina]|uniref:hypothetical protein n=1 Tax=Erwinia persicina TaxID=55211 RepID=UPI001782E325|nr:hypothetical protein [Erwinia persicina]MBD8165431.1 hypothetical protein [Erwinia persicina]
MSNLEIFHGTRQRFDRFDVSFKGTGEAGDIDACWFTDNFEGAKNHALLKNRHAGDPLVYRCLLSTKSIIVDHRKPLIEQPEIFKRIDHHLPVMLSTSLVGRPNQDGLVEPVYESFRGKILYRGIRHLDEKKLIKLYKSCGIHGVYDWEGIFTDTYLHGTTTIIFDFSELEIVEVIEI